MTDIIMSIKTLYRHLMCNKIKPSNMNKCQLAMYKGGDINNPVCNGRRQAGSITELYNTLADCKERVGLACVIDEMAIGYETSRWVETN